MWELTKTFTFEAAHTLHGTTLGEAAEEVHGHSFRAEVTLEGSPDPQTGMVVDFGTFEAEIAKVRDRLDHKLLNRVDGLGVPTLENLARFIHDHVRSVGRVTCVTVFRDTCGQACAYRPPVDA
jgi:6-pyruvoyltetrahydropterin/6-carboxytetrahydropterin synthase